MSPAIDRSWVARNLGIKEGSESPEAATPRQTGTAASRDRALQRELIDFDSEGATGAEFLEAAPLATGLSKFVEIAWPTGAAPTPGGRPTGQSLPACDVLIVTWTMDEGHALSRVLTPGFDSRDDWRPYTKNFAAIAALMRPGSPALQANRLGTYWTTTIGGQRVTLFKSDSHMSQDGQKLPNAVIWKQLIEDCAPKLVLTTGTGGGIGRAAEVGDVVVSRFVTFDCQRTFKRFDGLSYVCAAPTPAAKLAQAQSLFAANAGFLPPDNSRPPRIETATSRKTGILTTDFFGFDNTDDTFGLKGKGHLAEMGDAVLGMVCQQLGADAPIYAIVRNVSDPQMSAAGQTIAQQAALAATIYKGFGRWSSVCSAIVCWAIVASL